MENPNTWNDIKKTIDEGIQQFEKNLKDELFGYSMATIIYNKLLEKDYLKITAESKQSYEPPPPTRTPGSGCSRRSK